MEEQLRAKIEEILTEFPIFQYGFLKTDQITFKEEVRCICRQECERYGTSWSCPPGVGTVEECRQKCLRYSHVLVFTTWAEVEDAADLQESLKTRNEHEAVTHAVMDRMAQAGEELFALSSDSCAICETCTYPKAPCRHPDRMLPCIESHGILVTGASELLKMEYFYDSRTIQWFGMIFFHRKD